MPANNNDLIDLTDDAVYSVVLEVIFLSKYSICLYFYIWGKLLIEQYCNIHFSFFQKENSKLSDENEKRKEIILYFKDKAEKLQRNYDRLKASMLCQSCKETEVELEELDDGGTLQSYKEQIARLEFQVAGLTKQLRDRDADNSELSRAKQHLKGQLDKFKGDMDKMTRETQSFTDERDKLLLLKSQLEKQEQSLQAKLSEDQAKFEVEVKKLKRQLEEQQAKGKDREAKYKKLKEDYYTEHKKYKHLKEDGKYSFP